jgi:hypothetical protein
MAEGALLLREAVPLVMAGSAVLVLVSVAMVLRAEDEEVATLRLVVPEIGLESKEPPR